MRIPSFFLCVSCIFLSVFSWADPFVEGILIGQLGNQLFIIAAAHSLALDHGAISVFPNLDLSSEFNIPVNRKSLFGHLNAERPSDIDYCYVEPHYPFEPIPYQPNMQISGFFQSEKYFAHHKIEIVDLFAPPEKIVDELKERYGDILEHPCTVAVHMRYYFEDPEQKFHITYGRQYFKKAMQQFPPNALFCVFSNHMNWSKEILAGISRNIRFIEGEHFHTDFYLMSMCKHNIICNSSFSWWAAYLNKNIHKKVIAPMPWFHPNSGQDTRDLIPNDWIILY